MHRFLAAWFNNRLSWAALEILPVSVDYFGNANPSKTYKVATSKLRSYLYNELTMKKFGSRLLHRNYSNADVFFGHPDPLVINFIIIYGVIPDNIRFTVVL